MVDIERLKSRKAELLTMRGNLNLKLTEWQNKEAEAKRLIEKLSKEVKEEKRKDLIGEENEHADKLREHSQAWGDLQLAQAHLESLGLTHSERKGQMELRDKLANLTKKSQRAALYGNMQEASNRVLRGSHPFCCNDEAQ